MAYEIFEKLTRRVTTPMLTISSNGRMNFNTAASATLHKNGVEDVLLMWDKEARKIAMKSIAKKDARSYRLRFSRGNKAAGFAARTFLEHIGYNYSETKAYPCIWNEDQGMFETDIPADALKVVSPDAKQQPRRYPEVDKKRSTAAG